MAGSEGEDPQKLKRIAAAAYDYDNDSRWSDYWSNVLLPPNISRSDVVDHFKRKFYQRYIDPDLHVEPMSTSTIPARTSQQTTTTTSNSSSNTRERSSGSGRRTSGEPAAPPPNPSSLRWDNRTIQFSLNAWVFIVGILSLVPFVPKHLSNRGYRLSIFGTACSSLFSLYSIYGKPRAWNLQALQVWFQSIVTNKDFISAVYCFNFATSNLCLKFALIPVLCRSIEHVAKFLRRNFSRAALYRRFLEDACVWVESNTTTLGILSSQAEIGIGFLLIFSLFSWQRNIIQTFLYWQLLKLTYHAPVSSGYHQSAWARIGRAVNPFVSRYAFLNTPISTIQRWWFR